MFDDDLNTRYPARKGNRDKRRSTATRPPKQMADPSAATPRLSRAVRQGEESFKCVHCKAFIGPTVSGGKHRNHCPHCLYSRHVDETIGDRASTCRASMAPVARFERPNGEPVMVHRCLGCGFERHNRLAADDDWSLFESLPVVAPRLGRPGEAEPRHQDAGASGSEG